MGNMKKHCPVCRIADDLAAGRGVHIHSMHHNNCDIVCRQERKDFLFPVEFVPQGYKLPVLPLDRLHHADNVQRETGDHHKRRNGDANRKPTAALRFLCFQVPSR